MLVVIGELGARSEPAGGNAFCSFFFRTARRALTLAYLNNVYILKNSIMFHLTATTRK